MDMCSWKNILLQWINECGFIKRNYLKIEQTDIEVFYEHFCENHGAAASKKSKHLKDFLKQYYPNFVTNFDENCLSSADYIYVYSLLLHFCCVKFPETVFHEICQRLPGFDQQCIAGFFNELLDTEPITKDDIRRAIAAVGNTQITPPRLNDSFSSSANCVGVGGIRLVSFSRCDSPLKTPKHCAGPQRISPNTPKSNMLDERTRELYNLKAQLETERYEKGLLEIQIKQSEDEIQKLNNDHKRTQQQIKDLKNEIFIANNDGLTNEDSEQNQVQKRILKEISEKEQEILQLSNNVQSLRDEKALVEEQLANAEKKIIVCVNRIKELESKVEELIDEIKEKDAHIKYLTDNKHELEQFISETRSASANADLNNTSDCLDSSFLRISNNSNGSNRISSPENLAASVVDVKLREREYENQQLRDELNYVKSEHKLFAKHLTKLTEEFGLPIGTSSTASSEDSVPDVEEISVKFSDDDSMIDYQTSCEVQFNMFNSCVDKIDKLHKSEKNKFKQLEQQTIDLRKENTNLTQKLSEFKNEIIELNAQVSAKEKSQQEMEALKKELELNLKKSQNKLLEVEKLKDFVCSEVVTLKSDKEMLNENILQLQTSFELLQQKNNEMLACNKKLKDNEQNLNTRLQDLEKEFSCKTTKWQAEVKHLTEKLTKQFSDIEIYKQTEQTIKYNYEELVVQNEDLKNEARQVSQHLNEMQKNLNEKENQLSQLGKEIVEFKQNNKILEGNISSLMEEHKKELLTSSCAQTDLDEQLGKLKERLNKMELLMDSKHHECELKQRRLEEIKTEINKILEHSINCKESKDNDDVINIIKIIQIHIENESASKEELNSKVVNLEYTLKKSLGETEKLTGQLQEKCLEFEKSQEQLLSLQTDNLAIEKKISELQQQQFCIIEKAKSDLQHKGQELNNRLREASLEYDASLERIAIELKSEKEHHNNKDMELILYKAEVNEAKKKLNDAEKEIEQLYHDKEQLQKKCERLTQFEIRVIQCSEENEKLRNEIETFRQQVTQNALRLLQADKALADFVELINEEDSAKNKVEILQNKLKEKDTTLLEKLQQQSLYEVQIQELKQQLKKQFDLTAFLQEQKEKLDKAKTCLLKEIEEKDQQIVVEQQKNQQQFNLEDQLKDLMQQLDLLSCQNTKLQGDLVEREAEFRLVLDEQQQEKDDFQQELNLKMATINEKSDQLETIETALIEISAIIENNFNFSQEIDQKDYSNVFNYQENKSTNHLQKLRKHLNIILLKQQNLNEQLKEISVQKEEAVISLATLKDSYNDLEVTLNQQQKCLKETQELLQNEELIVENKVLQELKRLKEDLLNLESVNERLANENIKMLNSLDNMEQELKNSKIKIKNFEEEIHNKSSIIEKLKNDEKNLQNTLEDKCQQLEKMSEKCKRLEIQLKDKTNKLQNLEKEYHDSKEKACKNEQKLSHYQHTQQTQEGECKKLQETLKSLQISNDSLDSELEAKNKQCLELKNKNFDLLLQHKNQEQQYQLTLQNHDEMLTNKLNAEAKCEQLQSEIYQLKRDLDLRKVQHQAQQEDYNRLNQEIESLKEDRQHLKDEIHENKLILQRANDNVSQLIQQISSTRLEKEASLEENILLRKQLEETGKSQTSSETKMKSLIEKSQDLERKLLAAENELKSVRTNLEKSECSAEKLQLENKKLRDNQEVSTKRVEKLAVKLGDSQAKNSKLERDSEKLGRTLKSHADSVDALRREKDLLQSEGKSLKERLSRAERGHEQLVVKVKNLEHLNTNLLQIKQKLEASEIDDKTKLNKLEKMREINEEKLRKLNNFLNNAENENVKLNLEIGALNSQLQEIKVAQNHDQTQTIQELNQKVTETQDLQYKYEEINEKLKIKFNTVKEENSSLHDQLSKASLSLKLTSEKCERFAAEMEQIRAEILILKEEKTQIQQQHETSMQKIIQFESQSKQIVNGNQNQIKTLEQKINNLEEELTVKTKKVVDLEKEIELLKENSVTQQLTADNLTELKDLRSKISLAEDLRLKDQQIISQLRVDNEVLHTKYQESKQRIFDAAKLSEERIKDNRLELEGKLEKMKNKMKTLYTEEISKMKTKQERELAIHKSEMEVLKNQNAKYEEHTRKLSNQIVRLNDNILQHQKDNTILTTKLKHLTDQLQEVERSKRTAAIHVSSTSLSKASVTGPNIGTNLTMEDEEGEVFNNTYLTDMKSGRMPELLSRDVCIEELKYRNSLLPPHLRSTYAAQFDHEFAEDDLKNGPHSLDDSMSALLSTTAGGTRKKCTGITHYKRPGPPTPSKNGRLSFGGSSEPAREILKESYVNSGSAIPLSKTPARFNFFASRFSMGATKDERKPINLIDKRPKIKDAAATRKLLANVVCTSTPRKSKVHFDQRRLLDQIIKSSSSPSPLTGDNKLVVKETKLTPAAVSFVETPLTTLDRRDSSKGSMQKTISKRLEAIACGLKRCRRNSSLFGRRLSRRIQDICTPTSGETTSSALSTPPDTKRKIRREVVVVSNSLTTSGGSSKTTLLQKRLRKKSQKENGARPSLYLRGNMFANYRTRNKVAFHDLNRHKSRKQRLEHFNNGRNIKSFKFVKNDDETDKTISGNTVKDKTYDLKNSNYLLEDTEQQEWVEDTFTFGEEQFERQEEEEKENHHDEFFDDGNNNDSSKHELVNSQALEDFDRFIAKYKEAETNNKEQEHHGFSSQGSSKHFEKLLVETDSNAPFDVKHLQFNIKKSSCSNSQCSSFSNHSLQSLQSNSQIDSQNEQDHTSLTTATPHCSPATSTCQLSRTIYGGTIIHNHRLPKINATYVRKSSIYVKNLQRTSQQNLESSSCNDVVLITDQTITFVDIMRMWSQMDSTTRIVVSFAILASFVTLFGLVISLCSRR